MTWAWIALAIFTPMVIFFIWQDYHRPSPWDEEIDD